VIESSLPVSLLRDKDASHRRALELFSRLGVWDTAQNSGVLIYLQLNDRCVEIVADRGINACVEADFWSGVCRRMEEAFREGRHEQAVLRALHEITSLLAVHFPPQGENPNELPDAPLVP
jgi:uncharacterized membrane protein